MDIKTNMPFSELTTMRLGGPAHFFAEATSVDMLVALYRNAKKVSQNVIVIGGGSNLVVHDEGYDGLVIRNKIPGFEIVKEDNVTTTIKVGGGEIWDTVVSRSVDLNLTGIEALSAIPGSAGAAPVQNIGAYGQEVADTIVSVDAYDSQTDTLVQLTKEDCGFSYRHSIFRGEAQNRYAIVAVTFTLFKSAPEPPFYAAVQQYFDELNITSYTPAAVRTAVIAIRSKKLPDPAILPNSGSFFKNAVVEEWQLSTIRASYPDIPTYPMGDSRYKIPTGWLIEAAGLKGKLLNGMRIHTENALVLINESAISYADLAVARDEIISTVRDKFQIKIEQEPLEI